MRKKSLKQMLKEAKGGKPWKDLAARINFSRRFINKVYIGELSPSSKFTNALKSELGKLGISTHQSNDVLVIEEIIDKKKCSKCIVFIGRVLDKNNLFAVGGGLQEYMPVPTGCKIHKTIKAWEVFDAWE